METPDQILLWLLLFALAVFPNRGFVLSAHRLPAGWMAGSEGGRYPRGVCYAHPGRIENLVRLGI